MSGIAQALRDPIALPRNRLSRFYSSGRLLDARVAGDGLDIVWCLGPETQAFR